MQGQAASTAQLSNCLEMQKGAKGAGDIASLVACSLPLSPKHRQSITSSPTLSIQLQASKEGVEYQMMPHLQHLETSA